MALADHVAVASILEEDAMKIGRLTLTRGADGVPVIETDGPVRVSPHLASYLITQMTPMVEAGKKIARYQ